MANRTKVLCLFRYWADEEGDTFMFDDSIMIEADFLGEIAGAFAQAVAKAKRRGWGVGPSPTRWMLTGYVPERPMLAS